MACAGFDCLANKGVLLARIAVPGMAQPLTVANAHLNARKAAGVSVVKNGAPRPAAKITTLPFSRCRSARRRM